MFDPDFSFKILLLGDSDSGKSTIIARYTDPYFCELNEESDYSLKIIQLEGLPIMMEIDAVINKGNSKFLVTSLIEEPDAILVVFDKSNRESYENLDIWVKKIKKKILKDVFLIFVGNKCDLEPQVSTDELQEKALRYQVPYIEVSAKNSDQIEFLFEIVALKLAEELKVTQNKRSHT